jgi:hypothetical protein
MRHPLELLRALGIRRTIGFNLLSLGLIVSALAHPLFIATPFFIIADPADLWREGDLLVAALVGLNLFNLAAGYVAMVMLAGRTLALRGRRSLRFTLFGLPIYWLLMGFACLLALLQFLARPHYWDKTPHIGRALRTTALAGLVQRDRAAAEANRRNTGEPADVRSRRA